MKNGGLIFAHNSREVDYALLAVISGGLAKKYLNIPLTLAADAATITWMKESSIWDKANIVFENIIEVARPDTKNVRRLNDGGSSKTVPFINADRASAWDITPYDRTLLLDSDFLIFSDQLNNYWDIDESVMVAESMNDIRGDRRGFLDRNVSDTGVHLFWATNVMFTKNEESKIFFDLVKYIRDNYSQFGDVFRFDTQQYRNDIAFSIAKHIMNGFIENKSNSLPPLLTTIDKDFLHDVTGEKLLFLINDTLNPELFNVCSIKKTDVHVMNKQSIVRNKDKFLEMI
jgi:hypothetical protein